MPLSHAFLITLAAAIGAVTIVLFAWYGTVNPCEIFKKEIAMYVQKQGDGTEQELYLIFGGFVERAIDGLTPSQCVEKIYEIKILGGNPEQIVEKMLMPTAAQQQAQQEANTRTMRSMDASMEAYNECMSGYLEAQDAHIKSRCGTNNDMSKYMEYTSCASKAHASFTYKDCREHLF